MTTSTIAPPDLTEPTVEEHWFARLGRISARRRRPLMMAWLVLTLAAAPLAVTDTRLDQPPPDSQRTGLLDMTTPDQIPSIEAADLPTMPDAVLLDVREPDEWAAGHAPQAVHIPLGDLARRAGELPTDRAVVCICRSGARSLQAAELLAGHGFDVRNLNGGMRAWSDAQHAVVTPEGTAGHVI